VSKVKASISMSLDGFIAGPNQSEEHPLGISGMQLHEWKFSLKTFREVARRGRRRGQREHADRGGDPRQLGATIMGRGMFGGGPGPWGDDPWNEFWGDNPPYHTPVFVLTRNPREPLEMEGGTTFHFVTEGIELALEQARAAAGDKDVSIGGGANVIQQYLAAGLLDEKLVSLVPIFPRRRRAPLRQARRVDAEASTGAGGRGAGSHAHPIRPRVEAGASA
jgi:dihydrofolate reductase